MCRLVIVVWTETVQCDERIREEISGSELDD